jgi:hypothetical protein
MANALTPHPFPLGKTQAFALHTAWSQEPVIFSL